MYFSHSRITSLTPNLVYVNSNFEYTEEGMPQVYFFYQRKTVTCQEGSTIQEVAKTHDIPLFNGQTYSFNCHGLGLCNTCRVRVIRTDNVSPKGLLERIRMLPNPWRLSCQTRILNDVTVWTQGDFPTTLSMSEEDYQKKQKQELNNQDKAFQDIIEEISPEKVKMLLEDKRDIVLLDVREQIEVERARIEGAILIPLSQLQSRLQELESDSDIIVFCHHGIRSKTAAELLLNSGFKRVRHMGGGIDGWSLKVDFAVPRY